ncbi:hypothetical protein Esi_0889_0001 [Ectocarpus siliculosus]|uniref:Uncharacterized protein n=1 Tax=Ectocarpus siliculosus TaxID=2880 RepID=D7G8E3_ECTSI|nr:hypothetical protein Esi_0889_0001 [Ectocarpus siliculosus]|eukprot:CBJ34037.1 hypothetical protein Esi_0889_0001 [Ectocarpus siliculosus]
MGPAPGYYRRQLEEQKLIRRQPQNLTGRRATTTSDGSRSASWRPTLISCRP